MDDQGRNHQNDALIAKPIEGAAADLDPHLIQIVHALRTSGPVDEAVVSLSATGETEVDVTAKLHDPATPVPGLNVVQVIGQIVTGTVNVHAIEAVQRHSNVISLKRATRLHPELMFSVPEIRADPPQLLAGLPAGTDLDGSGVIVGIVDYGCDYLHKNFRRADGSTRILFLWDQRGGRSARSPAGYGYGREYASVDIDKALQQASSPPLPTDPIYQTYRFPEDPFNKAYVALGYAPAPTLLGPGSIGEHGTHVMDIAAGNGRGSGQPGVAPGADIIFVHVDADDVGPLDSFGNSRELLDAVKYIFDKASALGRSCVVNLSLGTHGGPHDGTTHAEEGFDTLLQTPGRAIVIAAANSWDNKSHASGTVSAGMPRTLAWNLAGANDPTGNEMEVWYPGTSELQVTLVAPGGTRLGPYPPGTVVEIESPTNAVALLTHVRSDPLNGDNQIDILLYRGAPDGTWQVELATTDATPVPFHAWIERDDIGQSRFADQDDDRTHTLGAIACGASTIVVGSYDARDPSRGLSFFSSEGPTRDGKQKPEVSAPGHGVDAAWSLTHSKVTRKSGTSMAAPHVTGVVALLMQAAGTPLRIDEIRAAVMTTARRNPPAGNGWHSRYGMGRIDAAAVAATEFQPAIPAELFGGPQRVGELTVVQLQEMIREAVTQARVGDRDGATTAPAWMAARR